MLRLITGWFLGLLLLSGCSESPHWSTKGTKLYTGKVGGIGFKIELPEGMRQKDTPDEVEFDVLENERVYTPNVTIRSVSGKRTLEKYLAQDDDKVTEYLRKQELPGGFIVSNENPYYKGKNDYMVYMEKKFGDNTLCCQARITPTRKGDEVKKNVPLVEKMCLSLATQ